MLPRWTAVILASVPLAPLASLAEAQILYETHFDDASGWTFDPPEGTSRWFVDALPAGTPDGPFKSPPASLNYNGDDFWYALRWGNHATSPPIDLSAAAGTPTLVFWCNNRFQEHMCDNHESVTVHVRQGANNLLTRCLTCEVCYENCGRISPCDYDAWHKHTIPLNRDWGTVNIVFRTWGDDIANVGAGYFVDDLYVADVEAPRTYCSPKVNSLGCAPEIVTQGVPEIEAGAPFVITAQNVLSNKTGLFVYGLAPDSKPFQGALLCIKPPYKRTPAQNSGGNFPPTDCSGTLSIDFNAWMDAGSDANLEVGVKVYGQFWYRDPGDPFKSGLSGGIGFPIYP